MRVERRFHPRFDVNFAMTIHLNDQLTSYNGQLKNISLSGAQITVTKETIDSIMAFCQLPIEFKISFSTDNSQIENLKVRIIVNRRISNQQFDLGLKFLDISTTQQQRLHNLLAAL